MVGNHSETTKNIKNIKIFSLNFLRFDDNYPKRLFRLCNNISLKFEKAFQDVTRAVRDNLDSYLNNSYKTSCDIK